MDSLRMADGETPADRRQERLAVAAFVFVVLSLIALVAIPIVLLSRITQAAEELTNTILPANDALRELAFAMEERVTAARSKFLSDDPRYDALLRDAKRIEEEALQTLTLLAPRVSVTTNGYFESLQRHAALRDSIEVSLTESDDEVEAFRQALPHFDAIRDSIQVELHGFRQELMRVAQERAAEEARWGALQQRLSLILGLMALFAALAVGWFALSQQRLKREVQAALTEANRQRAISERRGDELERATEARARLLRGVTHDVKNPLGAAKGFAELLKMEIKGPLLPGQAPLVEGVIRSIDNALDIIADLLDLARADSGGLSVNRINLDLRTVVKEAAEGHRPSAEAAGLAVEIDLPEDELSLFTDPGRVTQVLGNLLSNAVKYTPAPGRISVRSRIREEGQGPEGGRWLTVEVNDTGPGIPLEHRESIFDEFTRLNDRGTEHGNGLGLAIARRIARLLGGELTVENAVEGGASFILWLPLRQAGEPPAQIP